MTIDATPTPDATDAATDAVTAISPQVETILRPLCGGAVSLPGDPGYDAARQAWNAAVDQRPAAVAYPADAEEAAAVVRAAAACGLRVAPQSTGHNPGPLVASLGDAVLLRTSAMTSVEIDPERRLATVGGGVLWQDVVEAAAPHGLAALHGSSPDVGVAGYSLGGGMGWYARKLGLQANSITGAELVTADGAIRWVDADSDPDLFWALRGGGGNLGVVTKLQFRLYPIETAYAGMLAWDWNHSARVLRAWADWSHTAPDEVTTSFRIMQLPPLPQIPEMIRGRQLVVIDGAVLADDARAEEILAPLRELQPEIDMFGRMPAAGVTRVHGDPEGPTPAASGTIMLDSLPEEAMDTFVRVGGPGSGSSLLLVELRQLGGQLGRPHPGAGVLPQVDGQFLFFACGMAITPEMEAETIADAQRAVDALGPWSSGRNYLNFAETRVDAASGYATANYTRLQAIRAAVDPDGLFLANHPVRPARFGSQTPEQR